MLTIVIVFPVLLLLGYFYCLDSKEKEPLLTLTEVFCAGIMITLQIEYMQDKLFYLSKNIIFQAFIVTSFTEELLKFFALKYMVYRDPNFNEPVDGIIYSVVLALGLALMENILYVNQLNIGFVRAFTAIPAHALFACVMGYYLGKHKFIKNSSLLLKALFIPVLLHGMYNFLIMSEKKWSMPLFIIYLVGLWFFILKNTELSPNMSKFKLVRSLSLKLRSVKTGQSRR
ncbi:MAG: PrsW family intramembrane metalloprotease [Dethiobacter sp.]|jgi:RsiW-degrading membrane proteinase PrsW (M82 family)|nr:PrsW family intramembrane metalloprotease [Dethiobacter sp.]